MAVTISTALAIYFVLWWVVLFVTLPFGVRSQQEAGDHAAGTDPGAPVVTLMARKALWTTLISAAIYGLGLWGNKAGLLTIERLAGLMGLPM